MKSKKLSSANLTIEAKEDFVKVLDRMEAIHDLWQNAYTGAGIEGKDRKTATKFGSHSAPIREELSYLYRLDGLAKKVINSPIKMMTKNWFYIEGDEDNLIQKKLRSLGLKSDLRNALRWQDVFGGSLMVLVCDDTVPVVNLNPEQPLQAIAKIEPFKEELNESTLQDVKKLRVYEKDEVTIEEYYSASDSIEKAGLPKVYRVSPFQGGTPFSVHESRCIVFDGEEVTCDVRAINNGWGDSVLTSIYDRLRGVSEGYSNLERVIEEFITTVWKKPNMKATTASGRKQLIMDEMNLFDMARHMLNTVMIDDKESFERLTATVTGLSELMTKLEVSFAGVVDIPVSILFGDSPKGLNASGSESQQMINYYESLQSRQEDEMREPLERLIYLIMISKQGPTGGKVIDGWELEFNPIATPSINETLDAKKKQADIDKIYWDMGTLHETEIRTSRFGGEEYSFETSIDKTLSKESIPVSTGTNEEIDS